MTALNDPCPLCGGNKTTGETTFTVDLGTGVVVVRRVPATVCPRSGEEWIDAAIASRLEQVVNEAKLQPRVLEVTAFA